jgi:hypothetical protein
MAIDGAATSHPKVEIGAAKPTVFLRNSQLILHCCNTWRVISDELRLKCGHRLYFVSHKLKIELTDKGPARPG